VTTAKALRWRWRSIPSPRGGDSPLGPKGDNGRACLRPRCERKQLVFQHLRRKHPGAQFWGAFRLGALAPNQSMLSTKGRKQEGQACFAPLRIAQGGETVSRESWDKVSLEP